jgi:hypothetical protein
VNADGTRRGPELTGGWDREAGRTFLAEMTERGLLERSSSPSEKADVFPQEVAWPEAEGSSEGPKIRLSERVEAMGGCAGQSELCAPMYSL